MAEPGEGGAVRFDGSESFEGCDEGFAPFWLRWDCNGDV